MHGSLSRVNCRFPSAISIWLGSGSHAFRYIGSTFSQSDLSQRSEFSWSKWSWKLQGQIMAVAPELLLDGNDLVHPRMGFRAWLSIGIIWDWIDCFSRLCSNATFCNWDWFSIPVEIAAKLQSKAAKMHIWNMVFVEMQSAPGSITLFLVISI